MSGATKAIHAHNSNDFVDLDAVASPTTFSEKVIENTRMAETRVRKLTHRDLVSAK